ncbi:MAG: FHA domain-containing protein [Deltaproteobacteria bacterium]|nr:FHA domain-containing protein [Deltaproteobacteria bacterium]MBW2024457.1 FHA domain-containing protein [Deltaproteobacteria bacterium]
MKRPSIIVQLVHIQGPFKGEIQEFRGDKISIGRNPSCSLTFPPDLAIVSRNHAEIIREGNRFKLVDHSANGTFVNGKRVKETFLKDGDVLTIAKGGPKVSFLTQTREEDVVEPETGPPEQEIGTPEPFPPPESLQPRPRPKEAPDLSYKEAMVPLVIQYGPTLRSYKKVPVTIGKHPNCHFQMDHPGIMDRHAEIFFVDDQYWIKDLTSQQLVTINGVPINLGAPLKPHDEISLTPEGPFFTFLGGGRLAQVEKRAAPAPAEPPPEGPSQEKPVFQAPQKPEKKGRSFFKKVLKR